MTAATVCDLLVVGGGMAGMSAAARAAGEGARVVVCEISDHLGGTALLSTGNVWTVQTEEAFRRADPNGDAALWRVVREDLDEALSWVSSLGVAVRERHRASSSSTYDPPPIGRNVDIEAFMGRARRAVEAADGWVLHGSTVDRLHIASDRVGGARVRAVGTGDELDVECRGVVLASGGFQASPELRARYLGADVADAVAVRSNPHSGGVGLTLGLQARASATPRMDTFYGVVLAAVEGELSEGDFRGLVIHSAVYGVVIGRDGRRLTDESAGAVPLANAVAKAGRAVLVVGPAMLRESDERLGINLAALMRAAGERGARFASVAEPAALAKTLGAWGYDGQAGRGTVIDFDECVDRDRSPAPPREGKRLRVGEGPVLLLEVKAAITSTLGGIRTDGDGRAVRDNRTAVPGLFAAGVDQGGFNVTGYAGGLSRALVFGRRAAARALADGEDLSAKWVRLPAGNGTDSAPGPATSRRRPGCSDR